MYSKQNINSCLAHTYGLQEPLSPGLIATYNKKVVGIPELASFAFWLVLGMVSASCIIFYVDIKDLMIGFGVVVIILNAHPIRSIRCTTSEIHSLAMQMSGTEGELRSRILERHLDQSNAQYLLERCFRYQHLCIWPKLALLRYACCAIFYGALLFQGQYWLAVGVIASGLVSMYQISKAQEYIQWYLLQLMEKAGVKFLIIWQV